MYAGNNLFDNILRNIIVSDRFLSSLNSLAFSVETNFKILKVFSDSQNLLNLMEFNHFMVSKLELSFLLENFK